MREILKNLYGITEFDGLNDEEFAFLENKFGNIPEKLIEFYSLCGNHKYALNCYDEWVTPGDYKANEADIDETAGGNLMLLNENQGVCCAVILKDDLGKDDPPVYVIDGSDESPYLSADNLEDFIKSALVYEAVFAVLYSSERILELSKSDYEKAAERLEKLPYHFEWGSRIWLFRASPDSAAFIVEIDEEDYRMLYGAASEESFERISALLDGIGKEM